MIKHNHIFQGIHEECPACRLIRPEVLSSTAIRILSGGTPGVFGKGESTVEGWESA